MHEMIKGELGAAHHSNSGRALVVDDDTSSRKSLTILLSRNGYLVEESSGGAEALELISRLPIDVALLDVVMPGLDGMEVCRRLKSGAATEGMPVLLITAAADRERRLAGLEAGADDFISKPIDQDDLLLRVRNAVRGKRLADATRKAYEDVRELEELKDHLMHMIVHDVRAPLMVVQGYLDLLKEDAAGLLNDEYVEYVDEAVADTSTIIRMVNMLYDIHALEAGTGELMIGPVDLVAATRSAIASIGPAREGSAIEWRKPAGTLYVSADTKMLERIMANIVGHALRHATDNGGVVVEMAGDKESVIVTVSHPGIAIPAEQQEVVFSKFGQAAAWGRKKIYSSGLALAFCKLAMEAFGGSIAMSSSEQGNVFSLKFRAGQSGGEDET